MDREVGEECSKYGTVTSVLIFEATEPGFPPDQAVRIFVQFERVEEATKARTGEEGCRERSRRPVPGQPAAAAGRRHPPPPTVPPPHAQALVDLSGRFFGGREVEAAFFEEERFAQRDLAPRPDEVRR